MVLRVREISHEAGGKLLLTIGAIAKKLARCVSRA